jgi:PAS domain S-box-containing protein
METFNVLLLEDSENDMELVKAELLSSLEYNFEFNWVISKNDFINAIKEFKPDIILSDYNLPQFNGLDAIKIAQDIDPYIPIIIVTGNLAEEKAADCIKTGAWDYVVKERLSRLPIAFENSLKLKSERLKNRSFEAELKLVKSKTDIQVKLLFDAIERAPSTVVITDVNGDILYVNPEFTRVTGYKKEEALGRNPRILQSGEHTQEFYKNMWISLLNRKEWRDKIHNKKKNGELYWEQASIAPIMDENNNINYFVAIKNDITELMNAKNKAEESNRLKSTFLATMSHELRTPLNAILGFSSLINDKTDIHEIIDMNKKINESAHHLLNIVESILDISIIQSREIKITKEDFYISEAMSKVKQYIEIEQMRINKNNININFISDSNSNVVKINTDKFRIIQILSNLLNNALKFTNEGSIEYGYTIKNKDITFFVKDTGIGIPKEKIEIIFDQFRQLNDTKARNYEGIGLGLTICKELIKILDGKFKVESEVNHGSTFYITLTNVVIEENTNTSSVNNNNIINSDLDINLENKTILIAEDTDLNYMILNKMLKITKANILWAKDGQEAIDMVKLNDKIDIILMDIMMPNVDGYDATLEIKKIRSDIYIIAQTAHVLDSEVRKVFEVGCNDYLSKPIKKEVLYQALVKSKNNKVIANNYS